MIQIELIMEHTEQELQKKVNAWLQQNTRPQELTTIIDIKHAIAILPPGPDYTTTPYITAMIIYKNPKREP